MKVRIDEIVVGERRREDMGDIQELAESIGKYGLLHPVVVDEQSRLVAGGRRLEAIKLLGWQEVEVRSLGELTDKEVRVIELEENLRRKDLTEHEKSKQLVELKRIVTEAAREENCLPDRRFSEERKGGRGKKSIGSYRDIEERTGIDKDAFRQAEQHVQAVDSYPELSSFPKTHAIEIARQLKTMPEPMRQEKRKEIQQIEETGKRKLEQVDQTYRIKKEYTDAIYGAATLIVDDNHLEAWLSNMLQPDMQRQWELVEEGIEKLEALRNHLKKLFGGPRLVKIGGENR